MISYSFSFTEAQVLDFFKKFRSRLLKIMLAATIIMFVMFALLTVWEILDKEVDLIVAMIYFGFFGTLFAILYAAIKKGVPTQTALYFNSLQVNGIIDVEYQLCETDFIVTHPAIGNVNHFKYDLILKVTELDGYVAVVLKTNQCLPILKNETTAPLIATLKSVAGVKK